MPYKDYEFHKKVCNENSKKLREKRHQEAKRVGVSYHFYNDMLSEEQRQKILNEVKK